MANADGNPKTDASLFPSVVEVSLVYHHRNVWQTMDWDAFEQAAVSLPQLRAASITFQPDDEQAVLNAQIWTRMRVLHSTGRLALHTWVGTNCERFGPPAVEGGESLAG